MKLNGSATALRTDVAVARTARRPPLANRLRVEVHGEPSGGSTLADDVRRGLQQPQKALPAKYFYDDRGSRLFDAICDLPEYYLTRTEQALLQEVASDIVARTRPREIVELGSGASRKTRLVLDALQAVGTRARYVPFDVSEAMVRRAARALLRAYPLLDVHAVVGDYERDLGRLPRGHRRLVLFLGSTIGNFTPAYTAAFLSNVRRQLCAGDHLLLGVDLVKAAAVLETAYNDRAGVTAEFNRNILRVVNRHLDADFVPEQFAHVAFFNREAAQIEMHLRARSAHRVTVRRLDLTIAFAEGETIHTEISRKFTRGEVQTALHDAGFTLARWYTPRNRYFGLALGRAV